MALSKYSLDVSVLPKVSSNLREKSRTTQRKDGKYLETSSGSESATWSDLIWSSFERLIYIGNYELEAVYNEWETIDCIFVNSAHAVVDEVGAQ